MTTTTPKNNIRGRRFRFNWVDGFLWFIRISAILIIVTLIAIQAVINLISDWNLEPKVHTAADEIDQAAHRPTGIDGIEQNPFGTGSQ